MCCSLKLTEAEKIRSMPGSCSVRESRAAKAPAAAAMRAAAETAAPLGSMSCTSC